MNLAYGYQSLTGPGIMRPLFCNQLKIKHMPEDLQNPELSYGAKAVGLSFNPGGNPDVDHQKKLYAAIIDDLNNKRA